jgi:hypothetical protein
MLTSSHVTGIMQTTRTQKFCFLPFVIFSLVIAGKQWWPSRRLRLKCDGSRAETRFHLSAKRTSPFKSAGASVQSTTGRRAVHISLQGLYCSCNPVFCSHVTLTGYPLHSLFSPFTSPLLRHCVPSHFSWSLHPFVPWPNVVYMNSLFIVTVKTEIEAVVIFITPMFCSSLTYCIWSHLKKICDIENLAVFKCVRTLQRLFAMLWPSYEQ